MDALIAPILCNVLIYKCSVMFLVTLHEGHLDRHPPSVGVVCVSLYLEGIGDRVALRPRMSLIQL